MTALVLLASLAAALAPKLPYFDRAVCAPLEPLPEALEAPALQAALIDLEPQVRECVVRVAPRPAKLALTAQGADVPDAASACVKELVAARFRDVALPAAKVVDTFALDEQAELDRDGIRAQQRDWCTCYAEVAPGVVEVSFRAHDAAGPERVSPYFVSVTERGAHLACLEHRLAALKVAPTGERAWRLLVLDSNAATVPSALSADARFRELMLRAHRTLAGTYRREAVRLRAVERLAKRVDAYDARATELKSRAGAEAYVAQLSEVEASCRALVDADDAELASLRELASLADAARALAGPHSRVDPSWLPTISAVRAQREQLASEARAAQAAREDDAKFCGSLHSRAGKLLQVRPVRRSLRPSWDVPHPPGDPARKKLEDDLRRELERGP